MKWVTRERPKVDRIACPWLIKRFVDPEFDAILKKYGLTDPALQRLALIVRGADTDAKDFTPESRGLEAIAEGFRLVYQNDYEQLEHELPVYDALYAWCQERWARETAPAGVPTS